MNEYEMYLELERCALMAASMVYFFADGELTMRDKLEIEYHNERATRYSKRAHVLK